MQISEKTISEQTCKTILLPSFVVKKGTRQKSKLPWPLGKNEEDLCQKWFIVLRVHLQMCVLKAASGQRN